MEGKRVIQPDTGEETRKRLPLAGIIAAVLAALLLGAALGLCLYASRYEGIFPVYMRREHSGYSVSLMPP